MVIVANTCGGDCGGKGGADDGGIGDGISSYGADHDGWL